MGKGEREARGREERERKNERMGNQEKGREREGRKGGSQASNGRHLCINKGHSEGFRSVCFLYLFHR